MSGQRALSQMHRRGNWKVLVALFQWVVINAEESGQGTEDFQDHAGFHLLDPTPPGMRSSLQMRTTSRMAFAPNFPFATFWLSDFMTSSDFFWLSEFMTLWLFLTFWLYDFFWIYDFMTFPDFLTFWLSDFWLEKRVRFLLHRAKYTTFFFAARTATQQLLLRDFLARIAHWSGILLLFWRFEFITNFLMFCSPKNTVNALAQRHFQTISECKWWWSRFWRNWCQWKCKFFVCQSYTAWTRCQESNYPGFWRRRWEIPDLCISCRRESCNRNWICREYRTQAVVWRSCSLHTKTIFVSTFRSMDWLEHRPGPKNSHDQSHPLKLSQFLTWRLIEFECFLVRWLKFLKDPIACIVFGLVFRWVRNYMYFRYVLAVRRFAGLLFLRIQSGEKQNKVYSDITATNSSLN